MWLKNPLFCKIYIKMYYLGGLTLIGSPCWLATLFLPFVKFQKSVLTLDKVLTFFSNYTWIYILCNSLYNKDNKIVNWLINLPVLISVRLSVRLFSSFLQAQLIKLRWLAGSWLGYRKAIPLAKSDSRKIYKK